MTNQLPTETTTSEVTNQETLAVISQLSEQYQTLLTDHHTLIEHYQRQAQLVEKLETTLAELQHSGKRTQQCVQRIEANQQHSQQREERMLEEQEESQEIGKQMLEEQKESYLLLRQIQKDVSQTAIYTCFGELGVDLLMEIPKKAFDEEFAAWGEALRTLTLVFRPIMDWLEPLPQTGKTAVIALTAVLVVNHAGTVISAIRKWFK
jgi:hypothetical protein